MSSRFNKNQALQPTPKICHKGPGGWKYYDFVFPVYPLQAYAYWTDPYTPLDASIAGQTILDPYPASNLHFGVITGDPNHLEIDLIYIPAIEEFTLTIQLMEGTTTLDSVQKIWNEPLPIIPWQTHLITWDPPYQSYYVECRIFS